MITKTFEVSLWATMPRFVDDIYSGKTNPHVTPTYHPDMADMGWLRLGTGTLTCNLIDPKDTVAEQVKSLEAQIQKTEADAQLTITRLRGQINNLLAICHDDTPEWEPDSIEREEGL